MVKVDDNNELLQLAIFSTEFKLRGQQFTLVSLQNIQSELEEKEMEAWQNLIRVLTHEIMNSITPISSLASTMNSLLAESFDDKDLDSKREVVEDIRNAVHTIEKRSRGLLNFVENYRQLTRIPKPDFEIFPVTDIFERIGNLMKDQFKQKAVDFKTEVDPKTLEIAADPALLEQVLINLCKNSIEAVEEHMNEKQSGSMSR